MKVSFLSLQTKIIAAKIPSICDNTCGNVDPKIKVPWSFSSLITVILIDDVLYLVNNPHRIVNTSPIIRSTTVSWDT